VWGFPPERFASQAFWDAFEQIFSEDQQDLPLEQNPLEKAQLQLFGLWKEKPSLSRRLLAYDSTNTYIASTTPTVSLLGVSPR
jgi:hypothetical protein